MNAWKTIAAGVAIGLGSTAFTSATALPFGDVSFTERMLWNDPTARFYMSVEFGGQPVEHRYPVHLGLRLDRNKQADWTQTTPMAQIDFDRAGLHAATLGGMPLLQRQYALNQQEGDIIYNWTDWGLLALGVAGLGYVIYEVADSDESAEPQRDDDGNLDNGDGDGSGDDGGGGLLGGLLGGGTGFLESPRGSLTESEYREWLDGGTGHMGDLD
ncbi:hypothetical protein [Algiphilus sp.]|uniref:hypothetical protein n=1 Tax=Algiphilus sp. TaxID=1872431 RepID=UPI003B51FECB